jgi:endoglucanase
VPNGATGLNGYWANGSDPNVGGVCSSLAATDEESLDKIDHRYDFNFVTGRTSSNTPEIENPPNFGMILADTSQQVLSYLEGIGQRSNLYAIQASPCGGTNPAPGCDGNGQTNMTFCAYEGGTCTFAGDRNVTFTANGVYLTKTFTNTAACNLQTFGSDPAPGLQKSCYYSPAIVYAPNSIYCGDEYQRCNYSTENIYAGMAANQHFYWGPFYPTGSSNSYACSLAYFGGDVAPGFQKACFYQAQQQYFIPHTGPGGYAFCAGAGDGTLTTSQCTFEGPQRVAYGANGQFTYRVFNDSVPCNNASFGGDPAPGSTKDCWVEMISGTNGVTGTQVGPDPASTSTPGTGDGSGGTSTPGTGGGGGFDPRLPQMQSVPQAIWVTGAANDAATVGQALTNYALSNQLLGRGGASTLAGGAQGSVPVFALYNIPGRDCGSYSAGGAQDSAAYTAWIDGITGAIGGNQAVILLEPDSLAHIPSDCGYDPNTVNIAQATADRFAQIAYAVQAFKNRTPNVALYLDGGNSHWLAVPEMAQRLVQAGVQNAAGFYSNVSNYIASDREAHYDYWVSQCIAFGQDPEENGWRLGNYSYCASQYDAQLNVATPGTGGGGGGTSTPGTGDGGGGTTTPVLYPINPDDMSTWGPTDAWFSQNMGTAVPTVHYVIDTSRNGQDRYDSSVEANAPYYQPASVLTANDTGSWCNPPGRGLGVLPTTVGNGLLDAYFWVKTVGQSDGNCDAAGATRGWDYSVYTQSTSTPGTSAWPTDPSQQTLFDPLWGMFDPQAGQYFPQQAFALVNKANPQFSTSGIPGLPNGTYTITNVNSGLVMDVTGGYSTNGTLIDQWSSNGQLNQEWQITNMGNNLYQLVAMNSGSCLDGWESSPQNGGALDEWSCYGGSNQLYSITRTNMATYTITNSMTGLVVEVPNSSTQLGTTLDQWQFNGSTNQQWTFTKLN